MGETTPNSGLFSDLGSRGVKPTRTAASSTVPIASAPGVGSAKRARSDSGSVSIPDGFTRTTSNLFNATACVDCKANNIRKRIIGAVYGQSVHDAEDNQQRNDHSD